MKKLLTLLALSLTLLSFGLLVNNTYAVEGIKVTVTEKIPGANCGEPIYGKNADGTQNKSSKTYECTVEKGFGQITIMLGNIIKYFTFLAGLGGVLFIVINGIMYSMGGIDSGGKDEAKKRIVKTLIGLTLLLLSGVILNAIAPWVYTF